MRDAAGRIRERFRFTPKRGAFAGIFVVTMLGLLSIGATLPVLPRYVHGPLGSGDFAVGIVIGAQAVTGLALRPLAGHFADIRGRRRTVTAGALLTSLAGFMYFVPAGVGGLVVARLLLGAGEGAVYTAGAAWVVDLAPADRRGQILGLYGLAIWGGLSLGPPIGELLLRASSFDLVWAFAAGAPLLGAVIATRIPESFSPRGELRAGRSLIEGEALRPGLALSLATVGYATLAAFIVLLLDRRGIGHGAEVFTAFAVTVVGMRLVGGRLPDRLGPARCAALAGGVEAVALATIALAQSLAVAIAGALLMGAAFALLFPSLALIVVNRVREDRRGVAMGTFTAFFDLGVGLGGPLAGGAAAIGGYAAAFWMAAFCALLAIVAIALGVARTGPGLRRITPVATLALLVIALGGCDPLGDEEEQKPNIVVVMTDDQDSASVEVMRAVKRLEAEGVTFENSFVTTPECCPSRATFVTGQYAHNHGVISNDFPNGGYQALDSDHTLPLWMRRAGYRTAYFGRYLNGYGNPADGGDPREVPRGWQEWHAPVRHTDFQMYGYTMNENGALNRYGERPRDYATDVLARKATRYIETADGDRPYFLVVAPLAPHSEGLLDGIDAPRNPRPAPRDLGRFEDLPVPHPPSFAEADLTDKSRASNVRAHRTQSRLGDELTSEFRGRMESLLAVDRMISRLMGALRESGELENTYVIFTSDNGYLLGQHRIIGKDFPYEESARVPLVVRGPGLPAGTTQDELVANIDMAPTILDIAGAEADIPQDGISLLPLAEGSSAPQRDLLIEYLVGGRRYRAIRTDRWKLIRFGDPGELEMYDLRRDPYELQSVAGDPRFAKTRSDLRRRLTALAHCEGERCR